mmetsp:Transcript_54562/g.101001  ORF Transcript_54562/g.101001 Transcript_54562/m.101001 type:complete len:284 (+) Transcript_54562:132-983(+)
MEQTVAQANAETLEEATAPNSEAPAEIALDTAPLTLAAKHHHVMEKRAAKAKPVAPAPASVESNVTAQAQVVAEKEKRGLEAGYPDSYQRASRKRNRIDPEGPEDERHHQEKLLKEANMGRPAKDSKDKLSGAPFPLAIAKESKDKLLGNPVAKAKATTTGAKATAPAVRPTPKIKAAQPGSPVSEVMKAITREKRPPTGLETTSRKRLETTSIMMEHYRKKNIELLNQVEEAYNCIVCKKKPRSVLVNPCRHVTFCEDCVRAWPECPICHRSVTGHELALLR